MKTLRQILEGVVVSADYKMSKSGRKYRAHRRQMGRPTAMDIAKGMRKGPMIDQMEGRAEDAFADLENEIQKNKTPKRTSDMLAEPAVEPKSPTPKTTKMKDMNPLDRDQWEKEFVS